jgi:hypothetical protein
MLATAWIVPIAILPSLGQMFGNPESPGGFESHWLFNGNARTVAAQFAFDIVEFGVLCAIAGISTSVRHTLGSWVRTNEVLPLLANTANFQVWFY